MKTTEFQHWLENLSEKERRLAYGHCPHCDKPCQPDCLDCLEEYVECEDCGIIWTLYHDDPADNRDETENWREYRIGEIEQL